jgi:class 3 adenylate cyclase
VTVLFCDVVGSTSLGENVGPEALLARYFEGNLVMAERTRSRLAELTTLA